MPSRLTQKHINAARAHLRNGRPGTFAAWLRMCEIEAEALDETAIDTLLDLWNEKTKV